MSKIVEQFDNICLQKQDKTAFYYLQSNRIVEKSFKDLESDVARVAQLLLERGLCKGQRVLLFVPPSYQLVVFMLASIKIGISLMYVDVWAGKHLISDTFAKYNPDYLVVSNKTRFLKLALPAIRKIKAVLVLDKLLKVQSKQQYKLENISDEQVALITMTTGSTASPKYVIRRHIDLYNQLELINNNMSDKDESVVLTTAFIYSFANILKGFSTVLPQINLGFPIKYCLNRKLKKLSTIAIDTIITTPDFCLRSNNYYPSLERLYIGGAILNYKEATRINHTYADVNIIYIYGATECNLMAMTDLSKYITNLETKAVAILGKAAKGVTIKSDIDEQIMVNAGAVLKDYYANQRKNSWLDKDGLFWHKTGDVGEMINNQLHYYGRNDVYLQAKSGKVYSNPIEQQIVMHFLAIEKCAFFYHQDKNHLFIEAKTIIDEQRIKQFLEEQGVEENLEIHQKSKIPCDRKHHTKINYKKLRQMIDSAS